MLTFGKIVCDRYVPQDASYNYFDTGDGSSDYSDDDKNQISKIDEKKTSDEKLPSPFLQDMCKLPTPTLGSCAKERSLVPSSSVFANPFEQAEQAKYSILEKHVRLTEAAPQKPASKQMCWKFKKGRCHLGERCRFFHDQSSIIVSCTAGFSEISDYGVTVGQLGEKKMKMTVDESKDINILKTKNSGQNKQLHHPIAHISKGHPATSEEVKDDNFMFTAKDKNLKKRFGVTDTLLPPKKALTALGHIRKKEKPWITNTKK